MGKRTQVLIHVYLRISIREDHDQIDVHTDKSLQNYGLVLKRVSPSMTPLLPFSALCDVRTRRMEVNQTAQCHASHHVDELSLCSELYARVHCPSETTQHEIVLNQFVIYLEIRIVCVFRLSALNTTKHGSNAWTRTCFTTNRNSNTYRLLEDNPLDLSWDLYWPEITHGKREIEVRYERDEAAIAIWIQSMYRRTAHKLTTIFVVVVEISCRILIALKWPLNISFRLSDAVRFPRVARKHAGIDAVRSGFSLSQSQSDMLLTRIHKRPYGDDGGGFVFTLYLTHVVSSIILLGLIDVK